MIHRISGPIEVKLYEGHRDECKHIEEGEGWTVRLIIPPGILPIDDGEEDEG